MPPRLPLPSTSVELSCLVSSGSSISHSTCPLELALRTCQSSSRRSFSTTQHRDSTLPAARYKFYQWQKRLGARLKDNEGRPKYMRDDAPGPFPSNPLFLHQPVLSERSRDRIHKMVSDDDMPIMAVSAQLGVDHRRVAAVVRMKEVENDWIRMGKKLAIPYAQAVTQMLPLAYPNEDEPFEPINEIHVHGLTMQQLFVPAPESRHFTREDAAKAFNEKMLSADARMPHKQLVKHHRRVAKLPPSVAKKPVDEDKVDEDTADEKTPQKQSWDQFVEDAREAERADVLRDASKKEFENKITLAIPTDRAEFRFKTMVVDDVGPDGRSRRGVGWRYGAPYEDRKKDQVKHPTKYE